MSSSSSRTEEHAPPAERAERRERPVLIVAFPSPMATPLPAGGEPVGRAWLARLGIEDREVSTHHLAFLRERGGAISVRDPGSRNGTWIDGAPLQKGSDARLADGTILRIGRTLIVYRERFSGELAPAEPLGGMIGPYGLRNVASTLDAFRRVRPPNVLIVGETGTGKELAAGAVSEALGRGIPVPVNMGAIASGVFESQLFGHVAGAFSDARKAARGIIAASEGRAVFLDEIGELPLELQPKLLRLLENREVQPVGSERPERVDVAIIAATNRLLDEMVTAGSFRRDLLARLSMAVVTLPALRDRPEDLFGILTALAKARGEMLSAADVEIEAIERLLLEPWPGNIRELAATLARVRIGDPSDALRRWAVDEVLGAPSASSGKALTPERVDDAMRTAGGNESEASRRLGISRGALRRFQASRKG